jgi:hypothetical protein
MLSATDRVVELLRSLDEARVAYDSRSLGGGASLMPSMWNEGSYAELERCLILMREGGEDSLVDPASGRTSFGWGGFPVSTLRAPRRQLWWHICSRYRWGEQRVLVVTIERTRQGPRFIMPPHSELVAGGPNTGTKQQLVRAYCWSPHVREELAARGVRMLASLMHGGRSDRIQLPMLLLRRRLGLPVEDDLVEPDAVAV